MNKRYMACVAVVLLFACANGGPSAIPFSSLEAVANCAGIALRWNAYPGGFSGYRVERRGMANADTTFAAIGAADTTVYLDAAVTGDTIYEYRIAALRGERALAFSDAVTKQALPCSEIGRITLTASETAWLAEDVDVASLQWSDDGALIGGVRNSGFFDIVDAATGQVVANVFTGQFSGFLDWNSNASRVAFGGFDRIEIVDTNTGVTAQTIDGNFGFVESGAWANDDLTFLVGASRDIHVIDIVAADELESQAVLPGSIVSLAFAPSASQFAAADDEGNVVVVATDTLTSVQKLSRPEHAAVRVQWIPFTNELAVWYVDGQIHLWRTSNWETSRTLAGGSLNFDGTILAEIETDETLGLYNAISGALIATVELPGLGKPKALRWHAQQDSILIAGSSLARIDFNFDK